MKPELTYKWWSENKAKTLLREPLSAALKSLDVITAKMNKGRIKYATDVEAALTATGEVIKAIERTIKLCLPVLHSATEKNLEEMKLVAADYQKELRAKLQKFAAECGKIREMRARLFADTVTALRSPEQIILEKVQKECLDLGKFATKATLMHKAFASLTLNTGGTQGGGIWGMCDKLKKHLERHETAQIESAKKTLRTHLEQMAKVPIG